MIKKFLLKIIPITLSFSLNALFTQSIDFNKEMEKKLIESGLSKDDIKRLMISNSSTPLDVTTNLENNVPSQDNNIINEVNEILNSDISQNSILPINTVKPDVSIDGINNTETESKQNELLIDDSTFDLIKKRNSQNIRQKINISNENEKKMDSYFGYNVFQGNPELFQASSFEPVGPDYIVGPGDEIIIMLWGETEINSSYTITRDGYVFLPNVGQVFVNGLTLEGLEKNYLNCLRKPILVLIPQVVCLLPFLVLV